jgi:hypothetical protein
MENRCKSKNLDGKPCSARPVLATGLCRWHDPSLAEQRDAWRSRGGTSRSNINRAKRTMPRDALDTDGIRAILGSTIKSVLAGEIDPGISNAVSNLARVDLTANEQAVLAEMRQRIADLEASASA